MAKRMFSDPWLYVTTFVLVVAGLFMVGSSSNYIAMAVGDDPSAFWWKQSLHIVLGFAAMRFATRLPYRILDDSRIVHGLLAICVALLLGVLALPPIANAHRWIPGPVNLQPSELAKLVVVLYMAHVLSRKEAAVNDLRVVAVPCLLVVGALAYLIVIEPDLGSAVMLGIVAGIMIFMGGLRWKYFAVAAGLAAIAITAAVFARDYRLDRVAAFFDPWSDPHGKGYQLVQSELAFGNGGLTGVGPGLGQQKALFLPAAHTDFIYSIVGEELGLLGCLALLLGFMLLFWRGMRAASRAPDRFGFYLALGLTNLIVLQALINMCVCLGLLPTKGLPLPFISYGGSSLLASMAAMGLLLNVSQYAD